MRSKELHIVPQVLCAFRSILCPNRCLKHDNISYVIGKKGQLGALKTPAMHRDPPQGCSEPVTSWSLNQLLRGSPSNYVPLIIGVELHIYVVIDSKLPVFDPFFYFVQCYFRNKKERWTRWSKQSLWRFAGTSSHCWSARNAQDRGMIVISKEVPEF